MHIQMKGKTTILLVSKESSPEALEKVVIWMWWMCLPGISFSNPMTNLVCSKARRRIDGNPIHSLPRIVPHSKWNLHCFQMKWNSSCLDPLTWVPHPLLHEEGGRSEAQCGFGEAQTWTCLSRVCYKSLLGSSPASFEPPVVQSNFSDDVTCSQCSR